MTEPMTDYADGDPPVWVGTTVDYFGSMKRARYEIVDSHAVPTDGDWRRFCPDGVVYDLWPVGVAIKFGNSHSAIYRVRRTSFRIVREEGEST